MSESILVALITAVPGTITAVVTLLELAERRREAKQRRGGGQPRPPRPTGRRPRPLPRRGSPLRLPTIVLGGLLLTVAVGLVAALVLDGGDDDGEEGPLVVSTTVPGTRRWTNTGITLEVGDQVTVTASGEVFHSVELQRKAGPDGEPGTRFPSNVLMSADHGALLGMIGGDGEPFFVGDDQQFDAPASGQLFLGINDTGVENNSGEFRAQVTVRRAP